MPILFFFKAIYKISIYWWRWLLAGSRLGYRYLWYIPAYDVIPPDCLSREVQVSRPLPDLTRLLQEMHPISHQGMSSNLKYYNIWRRRPATNYPKDSTPVIITLLSAPQAPPPHCRTSQNNMGDTAHPRALSRGLCYSGGNTLYKYEPLPVYCRPPAVLSPRNILPGSFEPA